MTGWIVAIVMFLLFAYMHSKARYWRNKMNKLYRAALRDQRELKVKIDKLEGARK
jgi:hypothetical protein